MSPHMLQLAVVGDLGVGFCLKSLSEINCKNQQLLSAHLGSIYQVLNSIKTVQS